MVHAENVPSDLALEIGADLDPKRFVAAAREFFAYVESAATLPEATAKLDWRVKVREGSAIIALTPGPSVLQNEAMAAYERVDAATRALASGDLSSAALADATLEHARKLSDLAIGKEGEVRLRIWVCRKPILFGPEIGDFIREETKPAYHDFGSIEGTLNAIQDGKGGLELRIRDPMWQRPVQCFLPEDLLADAIFHFRKRVELFGEIHYRKDDTPDSIRVDRLDPLPSDSELPSIENVRGLFLLDAN